MLIFGTICAITAIIPGLDKMTNRELFFLLGIIAIAAATHPFGIEEE